MLELRYLMRESLLAILDKADEREKQRYYVLEEKEVIHPALPQNLTITGKPSEVLDIIEYFGRVQFHPIGFFTVKDIFHFMCRAIPNFYNWTKTGEETRMIFLVPNIKLDAVWPDRNGYNVRFGHASISKNKSVPGLVLHHNNGLSLYICLEFVDITLLKDGFLGI